MNRHAVLRVSGALSAARRAAGSARLIERAILGRRGQGVAVAAVMLVSISIAACDSQPEQKPASGPDATASGTADGTPRDEPAQDPLQLGLSRARSAQTHGDAPRPEQEALYRQAIEQLEKARLTSPHPTIELYRALWQSYRNLAFMPVTFEQGVDPDHGVVPENMKQMRQALAVFDEAKAKFADDPATGPDAQAELEADLEKLQRVYVANAERQWQELNESGYRSPSSYDRQ